MLRVQILKSAGSVKGRKRFYLSVEWMDGTTVPTSWNKAKKATTWERERKRERERERERENFGKGKAQQIRIQTQRQSFADWSVRWEIETDINNTSKQAYIFLDLGNNFVVTTCETLGQALRSNSRSAGIKRVRKQAGKSFCEALGTLKLRRTRKLLNYGILYENEEFW